MNQEVVNRYLDGFILPSKDEYNQQKMFYYKYYNEIVCTLKEINKPDDVLQGLIDFELRFMYYINKDAGEEIIASKTNNSENINAQLTPPLKPRNIKELISFTKNRLQAETIISCDDIQIKEDFIKSLLSSNKTAMPYMFYVWEKMHKLCDILLEKTESQSTYTDEKNDLLSRIINKRLLDANAETKTRISKLKKRIDYVMSSLTYDLCMLRHETFTDSAMFSSKFSATFTEEGVDIYNLKDLAECLRSDVCNQDVNTYLKDQYTKIMKGIKYELTTLQKSKKEPKLRQKPYIEKITSYKIQKDLEKNNLSIGKLFRNVRISSQNDNIDDAIAMKKGWFVMKYANDILTKVQLFFMYVKEMFANTTINIRNHIDSIYKKDESLVVLKLNRGEKVVHDIQVRTWIESQYESMPDEKKKLLAVADAEKKLGEQIRELNQRYYSPISARIYGVVNEFLTKLILCEEITKDTLDKFQKTLDALHTQVHTMSGGGLLSFLSNAGKTVVNAVIKTVDSAQKAIQVLYVKIADFMRYLTEINPLTAILFSTIVAAGACTLSGVMAISGNIPGSLGMARYCAMGLYLTYFSLQSDDTQVDRIQKFIGSSLHTTDVILMIMKYGGFTSMHKPLLSNIEGLFKNPNGVQETFFEGLKAIIQDEMQRIEKNREMSKEENVYTFHMKLIELILIYKDTNNTNVQFFIKNTPKDVAELKRCMDVMIGDITIDYRLFPQTIVKDTRTKNEFTNYLTRKISSSDMRKYVALLLLNKFSNPTESPVLETNETKLFLEWMETMETNEENRRELQYMKSDICQTFNQLITKFTSTRDNTCDKMLSRNEDDTIATFVQKMNVLERFNTELPLFMVYKNLICKEVINVLYTRHQHYSKKQDRFTHYKEVLEDTAKFINEYEFKMKHPYYSIMVVSKSELNEITKKVTEEVKNFENKGIATGLNQNAKMSIEMIFASLLAAGLII